MSKITRATALVFGSTAGSNQLEQFGSLAAGLPVYLTPDNGGVAVASIQALSNFLTGWFGGVVGSNAPSIQDLNALCYLFAYQIAYGFQAGIPEYDAGTTYYIGSFCNVAGVMYVSKTDANVGNTPSTSTSNWKVFWNNPMTTLGDMIYSLANGVPARLAGNTTTAKQFLSQTGTGTASAAPVLSSIRPTRTTFATAASGNYTVPTGCTRIVVTQVGGGGGGGGAATTSSGQAAAAAGGGGGGYSRTTVTGTPLASAIPYVVGAGGTGATAGNNVGNNGGNTSFAPVGITAFGAFGGLGGAGSASTASPIMSTGGQGGGGPTQNGDFNGYGQAGAYGLAMPSGALAIGGAGGGSLLSLNSIYQFAVTGSSSQPGSVGSGAGVGGQGGVSTGGGASHNGANGADGIIIIDEFYD